MINSYIWHHGNNNAQNLFLAPRPKILEKFNINQMRHAHTDVTCANKREGAE